MPQFDFAKFIPQIFWLSICFVMLYTFSALVILPRIRSILEERKKVIGVNRLEAEALNEKINEVKSLTAALRSQAGGQYQAVMESASKNVAQYREKALSDLKIKLDAMIEKSNQEVRDFISKFSTRNASLIEALSKQLKDKILNS